MKKLILAAIVLSLAGCASMQTRSYGTRFDKEQALSIRPGLTTKDGILAMFGKPAEIVSSATEETLTYVYQEKNIPSYLGGLVVDETRSKTSTSTLTIILKNDVVYSFDFKRVEN